MYIITQLLQSKALKLSRNTFFGISGSVICSCFSVLAIKSSALHCSCIVLVSANFCKAEKQPYDPAF